MRNAPDPRRPALHRNSLAVLEEIRAMLEDCARKRGSGCIRLEINLNQGVPSRLARCREIRHDIPLET